MPILFCISRRVRFIVILPLIIALHLGAAPKRSYAQAFTVTGASQFGNAANGFSPIRNAKVEIYVNNVYAASGVTTGTGTFTIVVNTGGANLPVQAYIYAKRTDGKITVYNYTTGVEYVEVSSSYLCSNPCTTLSLGTTSVTDANRKRAFFIFDTLSETTLGVLAQAPTSWTPSTIAVYYPAPTSEYRSAQKEIRIFGNQGGTNDDGFAASPVIHEYGHSVMDMLYGSYPAVTNCSPHDFDHPSSTSCAWTEGWADYFQSWVRNTSNYVFSNGATIEFETLAQQRPLGPESESAVTGALWDIHDSPNTNEPWDQLNLGVGPTWDVFKNSTTKATSIGTFQNNWAANATQTSTARKVAINFCAHQAASGCSAVSFVKK